MPEALRQDEVDALLSMVSRLSGDATVEDAPSTRAKPSGPRLTAPEPPTEAPPAPVELFNPIPAHQISLYDFKRPERVSKSQVIALEALHEVFARNVSASLSGYLRTIIELRLVAVEQFTYSEFTMSLPTPTSFNLLSCEPLEGHIILEVNPSILFPIIDRLLGGGSCEALYLDRPFTNIEAGLVNTILGRIIEQLRETWENVKEIDFGIYETESNPFLLQIVAPNEPIVLLSFEALMGEYSGMVNICIPFKVIEPIMPEFSQSNWFSASKRRDAPLGGDQILENIHNARVGISADLAETPLRLSDILALEPGDIIDTGIPAETPVTVCVAGNKKFRGKAGLWGRSRAVRISERVRPTDPDA